MRYPQYGVAAIDIIHYILYYMGVGISIYGDGGGF